MGRLNFIGHIALSQQGSDAAIVNLPDNALQQIFFKDEKAYTCKATIDRDCNYAAVSFSTPVALRYEAVCRCSLKSFPQFGSYGYVTQFAGQRISTIITNF